MEPDPIADFLSWYKWRPLITKTFLTSSIIMATIMSLGYLDIHTVYYDYSTGIQNLELWRLLTGLLYLGDIGFPLLFQVYMTYLVLYYSERDIFKRNGLADYLMLLLFLYIFTVLYASITTIYFMNDCFMFALLVVENHFKPFQQIGLVFSSRIQVKYFIWVYAGFNVLMGKSLWTFVAGFVIGLAYVGIKTRLKGKIGVDLWPTPSILKSVVKLYLQWADRIESREGEEDEFYEDQDWE